MLLNILEKQIWGNSVESYLWMWGILLTGFIFKKYCAGFLSRQLYRTFKKKVGNKQYPTEFVNLLRSPFELLLLVIIIMLAFDRIDLPVDWTLKFGKSTYIIEQVIVSIGKFILIIAITWIVLRSADFTAFVLLEAAKLHHDYNGEQVVKFFKDIIKVFIGIFSILVILGSVLGMDITSLITGLGISGLAIALAAQDTIANLIGSIVIFLDKPFTVGDLIESDKIKGVVEEVGFRSTKIRTMEKTLLTVPNKKLVDTALNNISRAGIRRVKTILNIEANTKHDVVKQLIDEIKNKIDQNGETSENHQVTFSDIIDNNIQITIVYFVLTADLDTAAHVKEELNYKFLHIIEKLGVVLSGNIITTKE
ncbi:MAG: mechanosensitive ion channel family protein [Bacteroidota bacterium]|nr:mechanosensitive ion channel family protein [Bacteroidota bacterium]